MYIWFEEEDSEMLIKLTNLQTLVSKENERLVQFAEQCQFFAPTSVWRCSRKTRPAAVETTSDHRLFRISSQKNIPWLSL